MEIIAEIGQNHDGDMETARRLIWEAKENGADVAKFQLYDARALFPQEGNEWFDYNCRTELSRDDLLALYEECGKAGIEFMASVFDIERIGWLADLGAKRIKIASRSISDAALIAAAARDGRSLLVSLGHWREKEFPVIDAPGGVDFLYCVSRYPTAPEDLRLASVDFDRYAGFSDHTIGLVAPMAAFARGARIVEKHFTLDKNAYGPDHAGSMTPDELKALSAFRDELARCL
jgi:sialic acid synthase SpsE